MYHDASINPRYKETDQMGVIYHGNYFTYFEVGRTEYMRNLGYPYAQLEKEGVILPVIKCECHFLKPVKYDEPIWIRTRVKQFQGIRVVFYYEILRQDDHTRLAWGETHHAFVGHNMKPLRKKEVNSIFVEKVMKFSEMPEGDQ